MYCILRLVNIFGGLHVWFDEPETAIRVGDTVWMEYLEDTYDRWYENWVPLEAKIINIDALKGVAYFEHHKSGPLGSSLGAVFLLQKIFMYNKLYE